MSCQSCEFRIDRKYRTCECLELDLPLIEGFYKYTSVSVSIMRLCNRSLAMAIPIVSETNCVINEHFISTCTSHLAIQSLQLLPLPSLYTQGVVFGQFGGNTLNYRSWKHPKQITNLVHILRL